jgi:hypothetical protein
LVSDVKQKRSRAHTGIEVAVCIAKERKPPDRCVPDAGGQILKRIGPLRCSEPGITAIRRRNNGLSSGQKPKAGKQNGCEDDVSMFHDSISFHCFAAQKEFY